MCNLGNHTLSYNFAILGLHSVYYLLIITCREERCRNELFTYNSKTMPHLLCIYSNAHLHFPPPLPLTLCSVWIRHFPSNFALILWSEAAKYSLQPNNRQIQCTLHVWLLRYWRKVCIGWHDAADTAKNNMNISQIA